MKFNAETQKQREKSHSTNFKATVNAISGISYTHFPLILAGVHPLVAPIIMFRLKRRGFSNCRVEVAGGGLVVYAVRKKSDPNGLSPNGATEYSAGRYRRQKKSIRLATAKVAYS